MINVEVQKHNNENNASLMRRFSRKVQSSGVVKRVRSLRYHSRPESTAKRKRSVLTLITRRELYNELIKLGRVVESKKNKRR